MTDPRSASPNPGAAAAGAPVAARRPLFQRASGLLRWESVLLVILALLVVEGTRSRSSS